MSVYVGTHINRFFHVACFLDDGGNQLGFFKFDSTYRGFTELDRKTRKLSTRDGVLWGIEIAGHFWLLLYEFLKDKGYQLKLFNPLK